MFLLWIVWIEILGFSLYALWSLLGGGDGPLTGYQRAAVVVYSGALLYGLYGFIGFIRRRLTAAASKSS